MLLPTGSKAFIIFFLAVLYIPSVWALRPLNSLSEKYMIQAKLPLPLWNTTFYRFFLLIILLCLIAVVSIFFHSKFQICPICFAVSTSSAPLHTCLLLFSTLLNLPSPRLVNAYELQNSDFSTWCFISSHHLKWQTMGKITRLGTYWFTDVY